MSKYEKLAKDLIAKAKRKGAQEAEAFVEVSRVASCRVRDGEVEDLTQATSKGVGLRVFVKNRLGFVYSSDFEPSGLDRFVQKAIDLASAAAPNPLNGLPDRSALKGHAVIEHLFDPAVANLDPEWKLKASIEMEKVGKAYDPRIKVFESVGAGESVSEVYLASSAGFSGGYDGTYVYLFAVPVASDNGQLQTSYWVDYKRFLNQLDSPEAVGKEAARRAVRMLGASKVKSQKVPVVLDPMMASSFVSMIAGAASGDAIFKKSSFLVDKLGQQVAPKNVTIVDDGLLKDGLATGPFDGEGVPTRTTKIVDQGKLSAYLYDAFTARKAKTASTGNASRGYRSLPHIGTNNLYLEKGDRKAAEIVKEVKNGFYVTAMLGHGGNPVTGQFSQGANGLWIENGELGKPVQEVTIAGNLLEMLNSIDAVGDDLEFRGSHAAPTIRFAEMTVSGE